MLNSPSVNGSESIEPPSAVNPDDFCSKESSSDTAALSIEVDLQRISELSRLNFYSARTCLDRAVYQARQITAVDEPQVRLGIDSLLGGSTVSARLIGATCARSSDDYNLRVFRTRTLLETLDYSMKNRIWNYDNLLGHHTLRELEAEVGSNGPTKAIIYKHLISHIYNLEYYMVLARTGPSGLIGKLQAFTKLLANDPDCLKLSSQPSDNRFKIAMRALRYGPLISNLIYLPRFLLSSQAYRYLKKVSHFSR